MTNAQAQTVETQFLRDGDWLPHVLIRRSEIGRVKFRHRIVATARHEGEWRQGRAAGWTPPLVSGLVVRRRRKGTTVNAGDAPGIPWTEHPKVAVPLHDSTGQNRWSEALGFAVIRAQDRGVRQRVYRAPPPHPFWVIRDVPPGEDR